MSRRDKLLRRFLARPRDFNWQELVRLLAGFGYEPAASGKTGGSRVRFVHGELGPIILHRPHPGPLKGYQLDQVAELLEQEGLL